MRKRRPRWARVARVAYWRFSRQLDRELPEWVRWLMPWGTSLAAHGLLLFVLAVMVNVLAHVDRSPRPTSLDSEFAQQLRDDVFSTQLADQAGDPFSPPNPAESPSISFDANPPKDGKIGLPRMPAGYVLGPTLNLVPHVENGALPKANAGPGRAAAAGARTGLAGTAWENLPLMAPFSGRSGAERTRLIRKEGGTVESEKAVERGLDWIVRHQRADGGWQLDITPMCQGVSCPPVPCAVSDVGATGLALLPLLAAGHSHKEKSRYQEPIGRGLRWLTKAQQRSGEVFTGGGVITRGYSHAIAAMALCEAYGITRDKSLREPAQRAIKWIESIQNKFDGGWRYTPGEASDTSVVGWDIFALRSAAMAGLTVNKSTLRRVQKYLDTVAADPSGSTYCYMPGRVVTPSMTAEGLVARQLLGWPRDHPGLRAGASFIAEHLEETAERSIYYWYYATQLLHNMRGKEWARWNPRVRDSLIMMQVGGETCARGSWDPYEPQLDRWGAQGGRLYMTSLSLLTLEVYYRYLPLYQDAVMAEEREELAAEKRAAGDTPKAAPRAGR